MSISLGTSRVPGIDLVDGPPLSAPVTNLDDPRWGLIFDGVTDNTTALQAVVDTVQTGTLVLPAKPLSFTRLNCDSTVSLNIVGQGGLSSGAAPATHLISTASGAGPVITAHSSSGFGLRDLMVTAPSTSDYLLDFSHTSGADTAYANVQRCYLGAGSSCPGLVYLSKAICITLRDNVWGAAQWAVVGRMSSANYSNAVTIDNCRNLSGVLTAGVIKNAGQSWVIINPTFEPIVGGAACGYSNDAGITATALTFLGGWCGDASLTTLAMGGNTALPLAGAALTVTSTSGFPASGSIVVPVGAGSVATTTVTLTYSGITSTTFTGVSGGTSGNIIDGKPISQPGAWINFSGGGLFVSGMSFSGGEAAVKLASNNTIGTAIKGCNITHMPAGIRSTGSNLQAVDWLGNNYNTIGVNIAYDSAPLSGITDPWTAGQWVDVFHNRTNAGAVSDTNWPAAPPDGTLAINTASSTLMARIGGVWKSVSLT